MNKVDRKRGAGASERSSNSFLLIVTTTQYRCFDFKWRIEFSYQIIFNRTDIKIIIFTVVLLTKMMDSKKLLMWLLSISPIVKQVS